MKSRGSIPASRTSPAPKCCAGASRICDAGRTAPSPSARTLPSRARPSASCSPERSIPEGAGLVRLLSRLRFKPEFLRRAEGTESIADGVEVGAFLIERRDGAPPVAAIHTSAEVDGIALTDFLRSLAGVLEERGIEPSEIRAIEYFHTHPARAGRIPDPISSEDELLLGALGHISG